MRVSAIVSIPRVYLSLGGLFLDFGWFCSGDDNPRYGITLTFERIAVEHVFTARHIGLKVKCGMKELAVIVGWADGDY